MAILKELTERVWFGQFYYDDAHTTAESPILYVIQELFKSPDNRVVRGALSWLRCFLSKVVPMGNETIAWLVGLLRQVTTFLSQIFVECHPVTKTPR